MSLVCLYLVEILGFALGYFLCLQFNKAPKFKPGQLVQYGSIRVKVKHIGWSDFHRQWTYYLVHDDWEGYVLAEHLKK